MRGRHRLAESMAGAPIPDAMAERIAAVWAMERDTPRVDAPRDAHPDTGGASPWKQYLRLPRRCRACGAKPIVKDGCYWCERCHPDQKALAA